MCYQLPVAPPLCSTSQKLLAQGLSVLALIAISGCASVKEYIPGTDSGVARERNALSSQAAAEVIAFHIRQHTLTSDGRQSATFRGQYYETGFVAGAYNKRSSVTVNDEGIHAEWSCTVNNRTGRVRGGGQAYGS